MKNTKEHIFKVALALFLQKNFKEVTLEEIVKKTGMSKGAFYHYFKSKKKIFFAVIDHFMSYMMIDYSKLDQNSLFQFYHDYISISDNRTKAFYGIQDKSINFGVMNAFTIILDALKVSPVFRNKIVERLNTEHEAWINIISKARKNNEIKSSMSNEQIAQFFIYMTDGISMHSILKGEVINFHADILALWDSFYNELKV